MVNSWFIAGWQSPILGDSPMFKNNGCPNQLKKIATMFFDGIIGNLISLSNHFLSQTYQRARSCRAPATPKCLHARCLLHLVPCSFAISGYPGINTNKNMWKSHRESLWELSTCLHRPRFPSWVKIRGSQVTSVSNANPGWLNLMHYLGYVFFTGLSIDMEVSKIDGWFHGKSEHPMDDVFLF